jgi:hypothetical protein
LCHRRSRIHRCQVGNRSRRDHAELLLGDAEHSHGRLELSARELKILLLGNGLCELGLQGIDSLLIRRDESVGGGGDGERTDDEQDAKGSEKVGLTVQRSRSAKAAVDDIEPRA